MEGGDDIGVGGPGIEKVAGASGFDWEIGMNDPQPQKQDLDLPLVGVDILTTDVRDRFNEVEALSGWDHDDVLRGDDVVPAGVGGAGFIGKDVLTRAGVDRIHGLDVLLPAGADCQWGHLGSRQHPCSVAPGATPWKGAVRATSWTATHGCECSCGHRTCLRRTWPTPCWSTA